MRKVLYILAAAACFVLASAAAFAAADAIRSSSRPTRVTVRLAGTIAACENDHTHALFVRRRCAKGYRRIKWTGRARAGAPGRSGAAGANGTNGANGLNGAPGTISIGAVTTGAAGSTPSITNSGNADAAILNFTIPQGEVGETGDPGTPGSPGTNGLAGAGGAGAWGQPVPLTASPINACPYIPANGATAGTPATAITYQGAMYLYIGSACAEVASSGADQTDPQTQTSEWQPIANAGANGTANDWALIDPNASTPVIGYGGATTLKPSISKVSTGDYLVSLGGCTNTSVPNGTLMPAAVTVTPEQYTGESASDSSITQVFGDAVDPVSVGTEPDGTGGFEVHVYLTAPSGTGGPLTALDEPFAITANC